MRWYNRPKKNHQETKLERRKYDSLTDHMERELERVLRKGDYSLEEKNVFHRATFKGRPIEFSLPPSLTKQLYFLSGAR